MPDAFLKIHLHNRYPRSPKLNMLIPETFNDINSVKILPHELPEYPVSFAMQVSAGAGAEQ